MATQNNQNNLTIPIVLLILVIVGATSGGVWTVSSLNTSIVTLNTTIGKLEKLVKANDDRQREEQRHNETRLTRLEIQKGIETP